jgi:hypothetical protein
MQSVATVWAMTVAIVDVNATAQCLIISVVVDSIAKNTVASTVESTVEARQWNTMIYVHAGFAHCNTFLEGLPVIRRTPIFIVFLQVGCHKIGHRFDKISHMIECK